MSGHSKWHSIKHQKAKEDQKKGKVFSQLVREITISAKIGGKDASMNPRLRLAIEKANEANMPKDNIERAIKRGTGELPGVSYIEITYEGYGPGGAAVMVLASTDNKNRTASDVRRIFVDNGGSLGETGCVQWLFKKKGCILINKNEMSEDDLMEKIIDFSIEDFKSDDEEIYEIITAPEKFEEIQNKLKEFVKCDNAEITMLPDTYLKLTGKNAERMLKLMDGLDDNEDVQSVFANFDI